MSLTTQLVALGFQAVITLTLALVHLSLGRQRLGRFHYTWAAAWGLYAVRLGLISCFLVTRSDGWLFAHQVATGISALLLLWGTLQFAQGIRWRRRYLGFPLAIILWSAFTVFRMHDMATAGLTGAVLLSFVTLWTASVFFVRHRRTGSGGALVLAVTFAVWAVHHLDYPIWRSLGQGVLYGVFADVVLIVAVAVGILALVLGEGRRSLADRNDQLEQLTRLLLRAQEDERRRIARELHDSVGQALTAVKIQLDLEQRADASAMVGQALQQVRSVSRLLRPQALDDLGLEAALRAMVSDFGTRTGVRTVLELDRAAGETATETQVTVYRVIQEALTNVARHADARHVTVRVTGRDGGLALEVEDDGRGAAEPKPNLGLLGMHERVAEAGGRFRIHTRPRAGFRIEAWLPMGSRT
ncbi:MAG TPA: sensor histidine kinase [Dongiaceae bacterium]|nr:sensor histidine kinase [Dongiaceae bacterium]